MSWSLTRPNTTLRVTKFAPEAETLVAGLTAEAHEAYRAKREAECRKIDPIVRQNALDWIDMPEWRVEELARKYAPEDAYEPDEVDDE